jgi:RNA polymerase sigma-70 factor, ECF subfamily
LAELIPHLRMGWKGHMTIATQSSISRATRPGVRPSPSRINAAEVPAALPALGKRSISTTRCERLLDDAALIERIQRGSEEAANSLVERLRPTILKCIRRRLPRWASEEDLVQTVLAKIFSRLHQFSGSVPLEHWVARIAVNASLTVIDYESVRPEFRMGDLSEEQETMLLNSTSAPDTSESSNYAREAVELLLAQLKPEERMIIVWLHIEQLSTQEISKRTGLSVSCVKVKAFRTRHKMARLGRRLLCAENQR